MAEQPVAPQQPAEVVHVIHGVGVILHPTKKSIVIEGLAQLAESFAPYIQEVEEFPQEELGKTLLYVCHLTMNLDCDAVGFHWVHGQPEQKQPPSPWIPDGKEDQKLVHQHHVSEADLKKMTFSNNLDSCIDYKTAGGMPMQWSMALLECVRTSTKSSKVYFLGDPPGAVVATPGLCRIYMNGTIPQPV